MSHPNTDKNPQRMKWTQRQGKTKSTGEYTFSKQISQTIWLDWYTSNRNREISNWRYSGWLSWYFRETQNGYWDEHGVQGEINPKDGKAVYSQSLAMPIHLNEDLIVELALMHKYRIITVLPFSKYASPIFAQRKPSGKLRLLVHLRKFDSLSAVDYTNNNHPASTLSDAGKHLAGNLLFCKLDCCQAYHCSQMADERSVEMLAFNFASRTFAYKTIAKGLSWSVSAFSSFTREYLDPVVEAGQCAQYVDDIGKADNKATDITRNIRAVFGCIR